MKNQITEILQNLMASVRSLFSGMKSTQGGETSGKAGALVQSAKNRFNALEPKQKKIVLGGAAGAVVLLVLIIIMSATLFRSPAAKLGVAFANTVDEFADVAEVLHMDDFAAAASQKSQSMDLDIGINGSEEAMMDGAGVRFMMDANMNKKKVSFQAVPYLGSADILNLAVSVEDEMIYFGLPELLPDTYGINTETMMMDLEDLGADLGDAEDISFNIFDLVELYTESTAYSKDDRKLLKNAAADLLDSVIVEKGRKQTVRVNGTSMDCASYTVVIPQDALEDYLEVLEEVLNSVDYEEAMEIVLESMNMSRSMTKEIMREFSYEEFDFDALCDLLDEVGDVELQVFVKSNKIAAVKFEDEIYGYDYEIGLYLGGGDRYVDNISLKMEIDNDELVIKSSGNHSAKGGVFTDKTTIEVDGDKVTLEVSYDTKAKSDNLEITLEGDRDAYSLEGTYLANKTTVQLDLDEIIYEYRDEEQWDISVSFRLGKYDQRVSFENPVLLSDLTEDDLIAIVGDVENMATAWAEEMLEDYPELMYYLF